MVEQIWLCYKGTSVQLLRYVDSDFADDVDSQRSTTGYVFTLESGADMAKGFLKELGKE